MARYERSREIIQTPVDTEYIRQRESAGWRLFAVEWERALPASLEDAPEAPAPAASITEEVPYGFRVATDCNHLEENPLEMQVLRFISELVVQDLGFPRMAEELNQRDFRTRDGRLWTPVGVFKLFPRVIEISPRIFAAEDWQASRNKLSARVTWNS